MNQTLEVAGLVFELHRSARRHTLGLTVGRTGELIAHAPATASVDEICNWIRTKLLWVHGKLALKAQGAAKMRAPEYVSGEGFSYLGRKIRITVVKKQTQPLEFRDSHFFLRQDARPAHQYFRRWYMQAGTEWLRRRVEVLSRYTGSKPTRVEVRELGFRWASCTKSKVLFFNWKVLQLPVRFVDYIILHELTHINQRYHDREFWAAVARALPDWQKRKEELAQTATEYLVFDLQQSCQGDKERKTYERGARKQARAA
jgi:predicted metal-dependent hydrolase